MPPAPAPAPAPGPVPYPAPGSFVIAASVPKFAHTTTQEQCRHELCVCGGTGIIETKPDAMRHLWEGCACLEKHHELKDKSKSCNYQLVKCFRDSASAFLRGKISKVNIDFQKKQCEWVSCPCDHAGFVVSCNEVFVGHFWEGCACDSKLHQSHDGTDACLKGVQLCGTKKRETKEELPQPQTNSPATSTTPTSSSPVVPALSMSILALASPDPAPAPPAAPARAPTPTSSVFVPALSLNDAGASTEDHSQKEREKETELILRVPVSVRGVYAETLRATVQSNRLRRRYASRSVDIVDTWGADVLTAVLTDPNRAAFFAAQLDAARIVRED